MSKNKANQLNDMHHTDLDALIGYNLKRAYIIVKDNFNKTLGPNGLAPREFALLSLVVSFPQITQSELARLLGIERSGLVAIVDKLEKTNFLKRVGVPSDRRVQALIATDYGTKTYFTMHELIVSHEERLLADFSNDEKAELMRLLQKIQRVDKNA